MTRAHAASGDPALVAAHELNVIKLGSCKGSTMVTEADAILLASRWMASGDAQLYANGIAFLHKLMKAGCRGNANLVQALSLVVDMTSSHDPACVEQGCAIILVHMESLPPGLRAQFKKRADEDTACFAKGTLKRADYIRRLSF